MVRQLEPGPNTVDQHRNGFPACVVAGRPAHRLRLVQRGRVVDHESRRLKSAIDRQAELLKVFCDEYF